jgi:hypothetical protein
MKGFCTNPIGKIFPLKSYKPRHRDGVCTIGGMPLSGYFFSSFFRSALSVAMSFFSPLTACLSL